MFHTPVHQAVTEHIPHIAGKSLSDSDAVGTSHRLLDAAGRVFAERGFANATVREICTLAGANVAAVNYHFGDKERLYTQVLAHALEIARDRHPIPHAPDDPPPQRLRRFIHAFLLRILDEGRPAWHGRLMAREMVEPTSALKMIAETTLRPTFQLLRTIVAEIAGLSPDSPIVKRCAFSVIGQCVMHKHCRPAIEQLYPQECYQPAAISDLAEHIWIFSLAGIRAAAAGSAPTHEEAPCTGSH